MTMAVDPKTALEVASGSLKTLDSLLHLIQSARAKSSPISTIDVINALPGEARTVAAGIVLRITELRQSFETQNIDMDRPINELQADYSWWQHKRYRLVREFNGNMRGVADAINGLLGDFIAIAQCQKGEELIALSFKELLPVQQEIDGLVNSKDTVRTVLENLLKLARELDLRAAALAAP